MMMIVYSPPPLGALLPLGTLPPFGTLPPLGVLPPLGILPPFVTIEYEVTGMPPAVLLPNRLFRFVFMVLARGDEGSTIVAIDALKITEPVSILITMIFCTFVLAEMAI